MSLSLKEIKTQSSQGRYFAYDSFHDRIFVPPAMYVVWLSLKIGLSGNGVSWISAIVAVVGALMLTSENNLIIFIGSFGYALWYFLDYVDGAVSRLNGKGSVSGQYVDWIMHVISHVAIVAGIAIGAMGAAGSWLYPFVILGIIASSLAYSRFSMAWFAICMEQQQRRAKGLDVNIGRDLFLPTNSNRFVFKYLRKLSVLIFHENYLIFWLPLVSCLQLFQVFGLFDLRVAFTVAAGVLYFPVQILEIHKLVIEKRVENGYNSLFSSDEIPKLPEEHFLK